MHNFHFLKKLQSKVRKHAGNFKYLMKPGLPGYCMPKIMNTGSGFFKL